MPRPTWTDEHSRLVAEAMPDVPAATRQEVDRTWSRVAGATVVAAPLRRRPVRLLVGVGIAAAVLSTGGVAVAGIISAHTGRYAVDAEDLRLGGPGERLDPAAPDYGAVVAEVTADVPFPSEKTRQISRQNEVRDGQREDHGRASVSTGALRFWTARAAVCAWANEWAAATAAGDASSAARAAQMLEKAPTWPAVTGVDRKQTVERVWIESVDPDTGEDTSSWVWDNTPAGYFPLVRQAVVDDDLEAMGSVLAQWGHCDPDLMPALARAVGR